MSEKINDIIIVGGGTAGWITACNLAKQLNVKSDNSFNVTLIESADIPTIGVGEGTWPTMRQTLRNLGINEGEFMRECDATFKQGTKFVNWRDVPKNGQNNHYYNLFSSHVDPAHFNLAPYWLHGFADTGLSYPDAVSVQEQICEHGLAPKKVTMKAYDGNVGYAYSLNAAKFGKMLRKFATETLGVKHVIANVTDVQLDEQGYIESVGTDSIGTINGDFFVDCSGTRALLIGEALGIPFKSFRDTILTNHAVFAQVPYESEDTPIIPYTTATAHESGWTWDIGLSTRRGVGYVYSDNYTNHDRAEEILRGYIGPQAKDLDFKRVKVNVGQREKSFHKNCLALGMAAAFIEPLEASAIFLMEAGSNMLADLFPRTRDALAQVEKTFNHSFNYRWARTVDFIKMHYYLSKRSDNQFWIDNRDPSTASDSLLAKLEHWKTHPISRYDFPHTFEPFTIESYQFVLYGMDNNIDLSHNVGSFGMQEEAKRIFDDVRKSAAKAIKELPVHRELINKIYEYGTQDI